MLDTIFWDNELIQRYSVSDQYVFPPPEHFQISPSTASLQRELQQAKAALHPISLKLKANHPNVPNQYYLPALIKEAELLASCCDRRQHIEQLIVDLSGAELLTHAELRNLMHALEQAFTLLEDSGDYCINLDAAQADWSSIGLLRELGFNHLNIKLAPSSSRNDTAFQHTQTLIEAARTLQFKTLSLSIDGVASKNPRYFLNNLQQALSLQPDRLHLHLSTHNAQALQRATCLRLLRQSLELLTGGGYRYISPELFSLPDDALAIAQEDGQLAFNLFGYSTSGVTLQLSLGLAATGQLNGFYYRNTEQFVAYQQAINAQQLPLASEYRCSPREQICHTAVSLLRCQFRVEAAQLNGHQQSLRELFSCVWPQLCNLANDGVISLSDQCLILKPAGRLLLEACCQLLYCAAEPSYATQTARNQCP